MTPKVLATSDGPTPEPPETLTFEVTPEYLTGEGWPGGWSEPVRFRFEQRDDGRWDLVFKSEASA